MIANDRQEKERADARNAMEEYVYDLRGKLGDEAQLASFVNDADRDSLMSQLNDMESWLYEEGEDCNRQIYIDKLDQLKVSTMMESGGSRDRSMYRSEVLHFFFFFCRNSENR